MAHLLLVTDHQFIHYNGKIYDKYVYDYNYFRDYLAVFDTITVLARIAESKSEQNLLLTSGDNVNFVSLGCSKGIKWLLQSKRVILKKMPSLNNYDAICYRIPAIACYRVHRLQNGKPSLFEMVGDPLDSIQSREKSFISKLITLPLKTLIRKQIREIVRDSIVGSYVSEELMKKYPLSKGRKANLISSIRLNAEDIKSKCDLNPSSVKFTIIHVGTFIELKNQKTLIRLIKKLRDSGYDCQLTLVGSGPTDYKCFQMAVDLGVCQHVSFRGQVTGRKNIIALLDENSFFIIPSLSEGKPRSLIEAMARGLICLGSARGGIKELLDPEFTFEPYDVDAIFKKIVDIRNHHDIAKIQARNIEVAEGYQSIILKKKRIELLNELKNASKKNLLAVPV
ncbi:glycosyltransferase involved in cell wall biosynthesis [Flavobacterium sp. AG291]|nr:glycosyltransferase involved in cell wall biosynthesis [Flavobacterium sp. AG291]